MDKYSNKKFVIVSVQVISLNSLCLLKKFQQHMGPQ